MLRFRSAGQVILIFLLIAICSVYASGQDLKLVLPIGHTDKVYEAHFSPDGKKVVTASKDRTAKIWDVASGNLLFDLNNQSAPVVKAFFSPDGKKVITVSSDINKFIDNVDHIKTWDAANGVLLADIIYNTSNLLSFITVSPDSRTILVNYDTLKVFDITSGSFLYNVLSKSRNILQAKYSPDGKWIVGADDKKSLLVFDAQTGKEIHRFDIHSSPIKSIKFSNDGKILQTLSFAETIRWVLPGWKMILKMSAKIAGNEDIYSDDPLFFTGDEKLIISGELTPDKKKVAVWDASSRKLVWSKHGRITEDDENDVFEQDNGLRGKIIAASTSKLAAVLNTAFHSNLQIGSENDHIVYLWSLENGKLIDSLNLHTDGINYVVFSPDETKLLTASDDGTAKIWDAGTGVLFSDLRSHTSNSRDAKFSPVTVNDSIGGKHIATSADDGSVKLWDPVTGTLTTSFQGTHPRIFSLQYTSDGKKIVTASQDGATEIWNTETRQRLEIASASRVIIDPTKEIDMEEVTGLVPPAISTDDKKILLAIQGAAANLYDLTTGKLLYTKSRNNYPSVLFTKFSPDGSKMIIAQRYYDNFRNRSDSNAIVYDVKSGKQLFKIEATDAVFSNNSKELNVFAPHPMQVVDAENGSFLRSLTDNRLKNQLQISPKRSVVFTENNGLDLMETETGELIGRLQGHQKEINVIVSSPDEKKILTTSKDNTCIIWDALSGKQLFTFFAIDSVDYFVQLPNGYYKCTPGASKLLHYLTKDYRVISFDQLDVKYNRPDIVLQAIGNIDTAMINTYRNAYFKRIKKLGIDTTSFTIGYGVPEADFVNRDQYKLEQINGQLSIEITGFDKEFTIDRYNVWVNEVPVYGQKGVSLKNEKVRNIRKTVSIQLSKGKNLIETSVTNSNGIESYRQPLIVNYQPKVTVVEKIFFIGIGIDRFANPDYNLNYSTKDIRDLSKKLKEKFGSSIEIDTLFNENVTIENVKFLKKKLQATSVNDKVIVSYSGHGLLSSEYDYYLSTYSVDFKKPELKGLPYDELENLLDSIPARKKLMFIDACHSGEVDKDEFEQVNTNKAALDSNHIVSKGVIITNTAKNEKKIGLKNSFELMQNIFVNVGKSTGAIIISAAAGTELALEFGILKNGVFTFALLEALDKYPEMKVSQLKKIIGKRVEELTKGMQKPTSRNEAIAVDWNIW